VWNQELRYYISLAITAQPQNKNGGHGESRIAITNEKEHL